MKYLVLFAVLYVAYLVWRNNRVREIGERREQQPRQPQPMVSCPVCGLHLPQADAVAGARGVYYCSEEHRRRAGG